MKKKWTALWRGYSFAVIFLVIFVFYFVVSNGLTWAGMTNILRHSAVIGLIALGAGLVILTGEIDLSVGSMLAFTAGFSVVVFNASRSALVTLVFALACGLVCGLVNGVLVGTPGCPASS